MEWIQPLELEKWIPQVFAGTPEIFSAIAVLVIAGMAGYFRMPLFTMFLFIGVFLLMFASWITTPLILLIAVFGGLGIGYTLAKIFG